MQYQNIDFSTLTTVLSFDPDHPAYQTYSPDVLPTRDEYRFIPPAASIAGDKGPKGWTR